MIFSLFTFYSTSFVATQIEFFIQVLPIILMGFLVTIANANVGIFLILRRQAMLGDAISHSLLPGIILSFILTKNISSIPMFLGALTCAMIASFLVESIPKLTKIKSDTAIGIIYTTFFALGITLLSLGSHGTVDIDTSCVLYGEISHILWEPSLFSLGILNFGPSLLRMLILVIFSTIFLRVFYKELLISSFDHIHANSIGISSKIIHYIFITLVGIIIVASFESVGSILVVAMLILPGASALLICKRMKNIYIVIAVISLLSSLLGIPISHYFNFSPAPGIVLVSSALLFISWLYSQISKKFNSKLR